MCTRHVLICLTSLALATGARAAEGPLVLAENGAAKAVILTPTDPSSLEKFAAEAMASCLNRITGGTFPIVKDTSAPDAGRGQAVISIGRTTLAKDLPMRGPVWKRDNPEAFRIVRRGGALIICGNQKADLCEQGTLWGVYAFLEMQGVGSYLPDPLGEVFPE